MVARTGGAIGYRYLFFAAELTVAYFDARAEVTANWDESGRFESSLSGVVIYPGIALMGEF